MQSFANGVLLTSSVCRVAINPKSQVVRRGKKRWKKVVHTAKMLPYEVGTMWPGETTGGRRTGPVVSERHPVRVTGSGFRFKLATTI